MSKPKTLGELKSSGLSAELLRVRSVRDEVRENAKKKLEAGEVLFPGIVGYDETVVPPLVNALLSRHHFVLLGLRGQAKSRILRSLVSFLDEEIPSVEGCELRDNPYAPLCRACQEKILELGDETPIGWISREERYVEKLATPDVTIADIIGDLDPIRAAKSGLDLSDELTIHYGLLPRAHRGIFAINELPDLAGKIQVGLFNILEEGDVQIKGYPVRLPLDVLMVFTANPEDYTARGKIITPLKDRIGSEIRTHYPKTLEQSVAITRQEAWVARDEESDMVIPYYIREIVEEIAFQARKDRKVDRRSGVSQRLPISVLENVVSNAERRALVNGEDLVLPRVVDIYASLPAMTGKLELEYEGELKGAEAVSLRLVHSAVRSTFQKYFGGVELQPVVDWFDMGGYIKLPDTTPPEEAFESLSKIPGLIEKTSLLGLTEDAPAAAHVGAAEFVLEGLAGLKKISRSEEQGYHRSEDRHVEVGFEQVDNVKRRLN
jgi:magnesium chelatase subunit I